MKCEVVIRHQGEILEHKMWKKDFDYKWIEEHYGKLVNKYLNLGYKELASSLGGDKTYHVFFHERDKISLTISMEKTVYTDLKDADGEPIILGKLYSGEPAYKDEYLGDHDIYCVNHYMGLYLRNITRFDPHVITMNGHTRMSRGVKDITGEKLNQKYIDTLNLHAV